MIDARKFFYIVGCLLLSAVQLYAQPKCKVEYYSTQDGLSHQRVTAMMKDREGFMWFGTWDGINRFNGKSFLSYKSAPGDSSQLKNDRIDQVVEDEAGNLWIMAYDNQIYRFDKKTERFLPLANLLSPNGKPKLYFNRILAARDGNLWLQSDKEGIFCVPLATLDKGRYIVYSTQSDASFRLTSNQVSFFYIVGPKQIWIGTASGLSCLLQASDGSFRNSPLPAITAAGNYTGIAEDTRCFYFTTAQGALITWYKSAGNFQIRNIAGSRINALLRSKKNDRLYASTQNGEILMINLNDQLVTTSRYSSSEPLHNLYEDRTGFLWVEPDQNGVIRFDPSTYKFQHFGEQTDVGYSIVGNRFKVLEDSNGLVWVNMKAGLFGYFNNNTQTIEKQVNTPDATNYTLPRLVYAIYYDSSGVLWLTTYERELVKIVVQNNDFKQRLLVEKDMRVSDNELRGIAYDNKKRLWLGTKSGDVYTYQGDTRLEGLFVNSPAGGFGMVYAIFQDSRGSIWLGTKGNGLYKASPVNIDETKYKLTHYLPNPADPNALYPNDIYSLLEDRQGRIWIGSFDKGLSFLQDEGDNIRFVHTGKMFEKYPAAGFRRIRHMALDGKGNLWLGTTDGLLLLNLEDSQVPAYTYKMYKKIPGDKQSLGNNDVQFIYRDHKNTMWVASSGGGLGKAVGNQPLKDLQFRNYTTKDGLPNDYVLSIAGDARGNLWLATENGLSRMVPETGQFQNYDAFDGLSKASFSEAAVGQPLTEGKLAFGTTMGYIAFDPVNISHTQREANIVFTNLQINNEDAGPGHDNMPLESNINYMPGLELKHNQNIISIDYAILDYRTGNREAFTYRLLGFDSTWHDDRQQRRATYTNLPPGDYVFEVKSTNSEQYSNTPYKQLPITILPPPWKTGGLISYI